MSKYTKICLKTRTISRLFTEKRLLTKKKKQYNYANIKGNYLKLI